MAMPSRDTAVTTIEEFRALPDDGLRYEQLDGVHVVTPAPQLPHQAVLGAVWHVSCWARRRRGSPRE